MPTETERLGDVAEPGPDRAARARVRLLLRREDLVVAWSRCGETADFLARYLGGAGAAEVLSTVLNEVVENAAKYATPGETPIVVEAGLWGDEVLIETRHDCPADRVARLRAWLTDPVDRAVQIEQAAGEESGLGLAMVARDFGARVGALVPAAGASGEVVVRVAVRPASRDR